MEEILLEFHHVTGLKGKFRLKDIHFSLPAGYIMGLMGENGAGKSTLMDYIMNEDIKYDGQINVCGKNIKACHAYLKNKIGFVSEDNCFFENKTAMQNAELLGGLYEDFDIMLFKDVMNEMQLSTAKDYSKMSRGEKLKFQTAFAMAHHACIYLLDEVTVGMDPIFRIDYFKILQRIIADEKASVLMTSHIASEIEQKTDYVGILEKGELIRFGESIDIIPQTKAFTEGAHTYEQ